jgi:bifunctional non-homologous end joining protein LigD
VGEVEYGEWTADPTDSDLVDEARLRHPVWRGWREDRTPADVVVE